MTLPSPTYRPSAAVQAANQCLGSAFSQGQPAELTVSGGPDDVGHRFRSFYRIVGPHTLEVIWEDIPPSGPIQASKLSDCTTLTDINGRIGGDDCHLPFPTSG